MSGPTNDIVWHPDTFYLSYGAYGPVARNNTPKNRCFDTINLYCLLLFGSQSSQFPFIQRKFEAETENKHGMKMIL